MNGVLLKPLSYPNPDRLIAVDTSSQQIGLEKIGPAPSLYFVYREQNTTLADIGAYDDDELDVTGAGAPRHILGSPCHGWDIATVGRLPGIRALV